MIEDKKYFVYVLFPEKFDKIYIGYTSDLENRLLSHNYLSYKGWTVKYRPWRLILSEEFSLKKDALEKENQLKSAKGRELVWKIIRNKN